MERANATEKRPERRRYPRAVQVWLITGLVMIFVQVVVGGVTRLTGSGLSITRWEIVTGTLPPMNAQEWEQAFDLYRATPQYEKINEGMSMGEFKFIYFWEYIHRLWARLMGIVFIIPFGIFWWKGWLDRPLLKRLGVVFLLAALVASFGWIMVASGLIERPWVDAYKLTMHLSLAFILYSYLLWTTFRVVQPAPPVIHKPVLKRWIIAIVAVLAVQVVLGGTMSGMKAALFYPTWPDMNGAAVPSVLFQADQWTVENFVDYDQSPFMSALVQVLHRAVAYLLTIMILWFFFRVLKKSENRQVRTASYLLISMLAIQVVLGIVTVINSKGTIPVDWGVLHQAGALLLLTAVLWTLYPFAGPAREQVVENPVGK